MQLLGPYELNKIYTGDAKILSQEIPDKSIDLVFTDPVYQNIADYEWLAQEAARVLKPDSACFVFAGLEWIPDTVNALIKGGLSYRWQFSFTPVQAGGSRFWSGMMRRCWITGLWFEKGNSKLYARIFDSMAIPNGYARNGHGLHKWQKGLSWMKFIGNAFSPENGTVVDYFGGSGTVPAVCKMLQRNYLAFEIDPDTADLARQRVAQTQPPLPFYEPQQLELETL